MVFSHILRYPSFSSPMVCLYTGVVHHRATIRNAVTRLRVDPMETIVEGFWRLFNEQAIHRSKAVLVM